MKDTEKLSAAKLTFDCDEIMSKLLYSERKFNEQMEEIVIKNNEVKEIDEKIVPIIIIYLEIYRFFIR